MEAASLLKLLEDTLPIHDIHIHTANDQPVAEAEVPSEAELESMATLLMAAFTNMPDVTSRILERLPVMEPFSRNAEAAQRIQERLRK
jgi:hypothetical protein